MDGKDRELFQSSKSNSHFPRALPWAGIRKRLRRCIELMAREAEETQPHLVRAREIYRAGRNADLQRTLTGREPASIFTLEVDYFELAGRCRNHQRVRIRRGPGGNAAVVVFLEDQDVIITASDCQPLFESIAAKVTEQCLSRQVSRFGFTDSGRPAPVIVPHQAEVM